MMVDLDEKIMIEVIDHPSDASVEDVNGWLSYTWSLFKAVQAYFKSSNCGPNYVQYLIVFSSKLPNTKKLHFILS